jgi:hypothetical protein
MVVMSVAIVMIIIATVIIIPWDVMCYTQQFRYLTYIILHTYLNDGHHIPRPLYVLCLFHILHILPYMRARS